MMLPRPVGPGDCTGNPPFENNRTGVKCGASSLNETTTSPQLMRRIRPIPAAVPPAKHHHNRCRRSDHRHRTATCTCLPASMQAIACAACICVGANSRPTSEVTVTPSIFFRPSRRFSPKSARTGQRETHTLTPYRSRGARPYRRISARITVMKS